MSKFSTMKQTTQDAGEPDPLTQLSGTFRKSSMSGVSDCVEVASFDNGTIKVRDSKDKDKAELVFTQGEWRAFLAGVRKGEFDI